MYTVNIPTFQRDWTFCRIGSLCKTPRMYIIMIYVGCVAHDRWIRPKSEVPTSHGRINNNYIYYCVTRSIHTDTQINKYTYTFIYRSNYNVGVLHLVLFLVLEFRLWSVAPVDVTTTAPIGTIARLGFGQCGENDTAASHTTIRRSQQQQQQQ